MWALREVAHCVGTLNPHKEEGVRLVMEMLKQVVELHPGLNTLHIGADEVRTSLVLTSCIFIIIVSLIISFHKVYILGEGEESKLWLASPGHTVEQLFLGHVTKVAKAIKETWPHMTVIMWDDMMRGMSQDTLKGEEEEQ